MTSLPTNSSQNIELKLTESAGGYWRGDSVNNETDRKLWAKLVPASGDAETLHGELLRCASKIYRDTYQNGGCNIVDFEDNGYSCDHCGYYETEEEEREGLEHIDECYDSWVIGARYQGYFELLKNHLPKDGRDALSAAKKELLAGVIGHPSIAFDHVVDYAIHTILTTENKPMKAAV